MKQIVSFVVVILALVLVGCSDYGAEFPDVAVPFTPDPIYRLWWQEIETCSNHQGNFNEVQWYVVPDDYKLAADGFNAPYQNIQSLTYPHAKVIVVKKSFLMAAPLIRHEILHMLLQTKGHPRQYFRVSCVDLVANWPDDGTDK